MYGINAKKTVELGFADTILNRPIYTSPYVPEIANGNKVMMFGDLKYYWVVDRQGKSFKCP